MEYEEQNLKSFSDGTLFQMYRDNWKLCESLILHLNGTLPDIHREVRRIRDEGLVVNEELENKYVKLLEDFKACNTQLALMEKYSAEVRDRGLWLPNDLRVPFTHLDMSGGDDKSITH